MKTWMTLYLILEGLLMAMLVVFWVSGMAKWALTTLWCMVPLLMLLGLVLFFKTFKRK